MPIACSTFGTHQVVNAVFFVNVRSFDPDWFSGNIHTAIHDNFIRSGNNLVIFHIVFPDFNHAVTVVEFFSTVRRIVVNHVGFSVVVEEERRVNSVEFQLVNFTPALKRIFCFYHHVVDVAGKLRGNHVERFIISIVFDGRSVNSGTDACILHFQLRFSVEHMTDLCPVHQIFGVENWHSREHGKSRCNQVIIIAFSGNGRVGIAALQNGIVEFIRLQRIIFIHLIFTLIDIVSENRIVSC